MSKRSLDWDIELAHEIGLITEVTPEVQEKLDIMHEAYLANNAFVQDSFAGTLPRAILESEAKQQLKNAEDSFQFDIKALEQTIRDLEEDNRWLRRVIRELREELE